MSESNTRMLNGLIKSLSFQELWEELGKAIMDGSIVLHITMETDREEGCL